MAVPPVRGGVCLVFYRVAASLGGEPRRWYGRCARAATLLVVLLAADGFIDAVSERGQIVATAERTVLGDSRGILWTRR